MADDTIRASDLEAEIGVLTAGTGRTRADYLAGDWVVRQHGTRWLLSIGLVNSGVQRWRTEDRDAVLHHVAETGARWLQERSLLLPGTLISIQLLREVDLRVFSWSWGVGGETFWVDTAGQLSADPPDERD